MKRLTTLLTLMLLTGLFSALGAPAASATTEFEGPSLNIPVGTIVRGDEGSTHLLGSVSVPEELRGMVCGVHATATNQNSVHPGNDIVVSSNGASVTLYDVEREGFVTTTADSTLQLGDTLFATLLMGKDKVFSGGITVTTTCTEPEPPSVDYGVMTETSCDVPMAVEARASVEGWEPGDETGIYEGAVLVDGEEVATILIDGDDTFHLVYEDSTFPYGASALVDVKFFIGGELSSVYTKTLTRPNEEECNPTPPAPVEVNASVSLSCTLVGDTTEYVLSAKQTAGANESPMTFSPENGTVFTTGAPVTVTATWTDPNYGEMSREYVTNTASDSGCTLPVTGAEDLIPFGIAGLLMVAVGSGILVATRRDTI